MFRKGLLIEEQLLKFAQRCGSAEELCAIAAELILDKQITRVAMPDLPPTVPAFTIKQDNQFFIVYKPTHHLSIQLSILHELAHICLGHLDGANTDLNAALSGKTYFADQQERLAERMAHQMMAHIIRQNEENEVSARYARLMPQNPNVFLRQKIADPRIALRYQALMP